VRKKTCCNPFILIFRCRTRQEALPARAEHMRMQHPNTEGGGPPMPILKRGAQAGECACCVVCGIVVLTSM